MNTKRLTRLLPHAALVSISVLMGAAQPAPTPSGPGTYHATGTVTTVIDGDTFEVTGADGTVETVRVLGIDTPETQDPAEPVQCWGPEATAFAKQKLGGQTVDLFTDPTQDTRDRNDRLLAYVILPDGVNYSVAAAAAGAARAYVYAASSPELLAPEIASAEKEAKQAGRGLWGPPCNGSESPVPTDPASASPPRDVPTPSEPEPDNRPDPRFDTCREAIANGYGPYLRDDPEYGWYDDRDSDGIVCER